MSYIALASMLTRVSDRPLICTAIIQNSGIRQTWWFLVSQFYIPAFMMCFVNGTFSFSVLVEW